MLFIRSNVVRHSTHPSDELHVVGLSPWQRATVSRRPGVEQITIALGDRARREAGEHRRALTSDDRPGYGLAMSCAVCSAQSLSGSEELAFEYPGQLCFACQERAVTAAGMPAMHDSQGDSGDNPLFVDGVKCWRRYRFGGYVTMRDDTPCESLDEFYGITVNSAWSRQLLDVANDALNRAGAPVPSGVGAALSGGRYVGASFEYQGRSWVVCRTSLVSTNAQLLDATVALKAAGRAERALAILDAPEGMSNAKLAGTEYISRYRRAAWHGLGLVFATADELASGWFVNPVKPNNLGGWLDDLTRALRAELRDVGVSAEDLSRSGEAEAIVKPLCNSLLEPLGFQAAPSASYQSYWRRPAADGAWIRNVSRAPVRVHLEVKLTEDDQAPFCQVFEGLGIADAVIQVRLVKRSARERLDALVRRHPWLPVLKKQVEERLPVRFIEVD